MRDPVSTPVGLEHRLERAVGVAVIRFAVDPRAPGANPNRDERQMAGAMAGWVVGLAVDPGAPDQAQPAAGENTDAVQRVTAAGPCAGLARSRPGAAVARVVAAGRTPRPADRLGTNRRTIMTFESPADR